MKSVSVDCFAKVHILQKGKKVAKKKTSKKHDARNPIFNEAMTFSVPTASLLVKHLIIHYSSIYPLIRFEFQFGSIFLSIILPVQYLFPSFSYSLGSFIHIFTRSLICLLNYLS